MTDRQPPAAPEPRPYMSVVRMVEDLFATHGDTHRGLGYPKPDRFEERYRVYLDVIRFGPEAGVPCRLLDIGCATAPLLDEIKAARLAGISYRGVDISSAMIEHARKKHPDADFKLGDPLLDDEIWSSAPDYVILGGLFSCRLDMTEEEMTAYMMRMLRLAFARCGRGIAFNVMSHHVDWTRQDLFHVPFDRMADLLQTNLSRNYIFRADYGLYEYTTYVYK